VAEADEERAVVRRRPRWLGLMLVGAGGTFTGLVLLAAALIAFRGGAWWEAAVTAVLWGGLGLLVLRAGRRILDDER
jgi:hypothetical protein